MSHFNFCSHSFRNSALFLVAMLVLALFTAPVALAEVSCEEGDRWVEANRDSLPQTIEGFAKVADEYRSSAFQALPAEKQTELWNQHLQLLLEERTDLSEAQLDEIRGAGDLFENPAAYKGRTEGTIIGMALGSFVVRLSGDFLVHEKGKILPVGGLPSCNCYAEVPGCNRVWCVPQFPEETSGRW